MSKDDPSRDDHTSMEPGARGGGSNLPVAADGDGWPVDTWYADDEATRTAWAPLGPGERAGRWPLAAAALAGAVVMVLALLGWNAVDRNDGRPASASDAEAPPVAAVPSPEASDEGADTMTHGATRLSRCTAAARALQEPLVAARPALDQWTVHVGAMNKLVVGEITLQQASDFWNDTRVGAKRNMAAFDESVATLRSAGLDCPAPDLLAPGAKQLPACARAVQAGIGALRAAQRSLATWDVHIHHMDMLRLGQMTPEEATRMWLSSWQQGVREIEDYRTARREARAEDECTRVAGE